LERSKFYGSNVSGPVFKNIAENVFIVEKGWKKNAIADSIFGKTPKVKRNYKTAMLDAGVPNVIGMGLNDAIFVMQRKGYSIHFEGAGRVIHQNPEPGTFYQGGPVELILSSK
jgi:cell division protein FtsI (penicillin-binding protein 3)